MLYDVNFFKIKVLAVLFLLVVAGSANAQQTRYVSDVLVITLRSGPGDQYRIIKTLKSGVSMEVVEEQEEFVKVRLADGTEGWARQQYLQDQPIASVVLKDVTRQLDKAKAQNQQLNDELKALKFKHQELNKEHDRYVAENKVLRKENIHLNQVAKRPLEIDQENQMLRAESTEVKLQNKQLREENTQLRESTAQKWFLSGSAVLLIGILAGLLLPKMRSRRSGGGWS